MAILGIDLGTSNSLVGYWKEGKPTLIPNVFGDFLTPSVVSINKENEVVVGKIAKEHLITNTTNTVSIFKRFMGTSKDYKLNNQQFTPRELSSLVLASLKKDAEIFLDEPCNQAVISVPAYFNQLQRKETIEAAKLANLEVIALISEPTAAALAYNLHEEDADCSILVVDLGGGTFDVSLLELFEGIVQVNAIAGDNYLGGENFTELLFEDFLIQNDLTRENLSLNDQEIIVRYLDEAKIKLDPHDNLKAEFVIKEKKYEYKKSSKELEKLWSPLLARIRVPLMRVLKDSRMSIDEIDKVILVGGSTKLFYVKKMISQLTGKLPYHLINPDEAIALGAVIQSELKDNKEMISEMMLTDVCAYTLGTDVTKTIGDKHESGFFNPIIERNSSLPISKVETFVSIVDNQEIVLFNIYQGEHLRCEENLKLGELEVPVFKGDKGQQVDVRFTYDTNGVLEVEAFVPKLNITKKIYITNEAVDYTKEELRDQFKKLENLKVHPRDRSENQLLIARLERLYADSLGPDREIISNMLSRFITVLDKQNDRESKKIRKEIEEQIKWFDGVWS